MPQEKDEKTLARKVYAAIRPKILLGEVGPGARMSLREVSEEHGVSLSVVREAMTRLATEELLESIPQQGFRVRTASVEDLSDLTWARVQIESITLRNSIERGSLDWECALVGAHHKLASTKMRSGEKWNPHWAGAHSEFHAALMSACESSILLRIRQQLYDSSEIYRSWAALAPKALERDVTGEHGDMLKAALSRNADLAVRLHTEHIQETTRLYIEAQKALTEVRRRKA